MMRMMNDDEADAVAIMVCHHTYVHEHNRIGLFIFRAVCSTTPVKFKHASQALVLF